MATLKTILIVDDEKAVRDGLVELLSFDPQFKLLEASAFRPALDLLSQYTIDLVLLDIGLPGLDGREACRSLRQRGFAMPIIMLTGLSSEADTISGLDAGANDYVAKPFKPGELLARIRSQLRQFERSEDIAFAIGQYQFRPAVNALLNAEGQAILHLTNRETALLRRLQKASGDSVDRATLLRDVWGVNPNMETHTLETHIYRLRRKILKATGEAELITTEKNGYKLAQ